jgi:hypothetical protein
MDRNGSAGTLALMELWCANSGKYFRYVVFHSWPGMKPVYGRT